MTEPADANRSDCRHGLALCENCGGLEITEWARLGGVGTVELGGQEVAVTDVFISPGPKPCDKPRET